MMIIYRSRANFTNAKRSKTSLLPALIVALMLITLVNIFLLLSYTGEIKSLEESKKEIEQLQEKLEQEFEKIKNHYEISSLKPNFNKDDVTEISNVSLEELNNKLKNTEFEGLAYMFIKAEQEFKVNALFLVGLTANESGWGTSRLAQGKNNLTGFQAYNHDPYNSAKHFDSWEDCIMQTAEYIRNNYLNIDGNYYNGLGVRDINIRYAINDDGSTNYTWSNTIINIANKLKGE